MFLVRKASGLGVMLKTRWARFAAAVLAAAVVAACSDQTEGEGTGSNENAGPAIIHTYAVKGRIVSLPAPSNPASELRIHHEAINEFKHSDGRPAPMKSMTMPFPPAAGVSLDGFSEGDVVEFTFDVQWEPTPGMSLTAIDKLPADTGLSFEQSPGDTGGDSGSTDAHDGGHVGH